MKHPVPMRRATDAAKLTFSAPVVATVVVWVLMLAAAWYGVQSRLGEIQTDVKLLSAKLDTQGETSALKQQQWEARIKELEVNHKALDIRIRQLETEAVRRK